jgi:hypothetical protein
MIPLHVILIIGAGFCVIVGLSQVITADIPGALLWMFIAEAAHILASLVREI